MKKFILIILILIQSCAMDKDVLITISTPYGEMKAILYDETPLHKKNFIELSESGKFDSTIFHRVIENFMIQGGDVNLISENEIDYTIPAEFNDNLFHRKGEIAAARMGDNVNPDKESSGCQFYIVHGKVYKEEELTLDINALYGGVRRLLQEEEYSDMRQKFIDAQNDPEETQKLAISLSEICEEKYGMQIRKTISDEILKAYTTVGGVPHLDGAYTVFGRIVEGLEVIDKIASVKTGAADKPVEDIPMTFKIKKISKEKITKDYGYSYPQ
ncbi:MAG: peptidylprolyl isomerase [Cytophagia bacterium]|jgi:peptidyl-prolyl cis-trans isomerase B (cyclophilin B)|nr:peptidylprolyl isomerase [Cytophagia bacterium]|tara:strand:- start:207 stop:1022 length:816 start_codon:yes stop_codon:yes gene_type:complete